MEQVIRDERGWVIGKIVTGSNNTAVAYDKRGWKVGSFDGTTTYDERGWRVGTGNLLAALIWEKK